MILEWGFAAQNDDLPTVESFLRGKLVDVNVLVDTGVMGLGLRWDRWGATALHIASFERRFRIVRFLIEQGAKVNAKCTMGCPVIVWAIQRGDENIVRLLLEHKADPNVRDARDLTPIHIASLREKVEIVHLLLQYGADIDARDKYGRTPLCHICGCPISSTRIEIARLLLDNGADLSAKDKGGYSALKTACCRRNAKLVQLLLERGADKELNMRIESTGMTLLHETVFTLMDNVKVMEVLLGFGADPTLKDSRGSLPLEYACKEHKVSFIYILFQRMLSDGSIRFNRQGVRRCR